MILFKALNLILGILRIALIGIVAAAMMFVAYRGSQPMNLPQVPGGMSYWQFMRDRIDAAKEVRPGRCGYGMFGFLALAGPFYSVLYTYVGIHPDSFLAHVTQPDPSIPRGVTGAAWYQVPEIWWLVVEKLSWSALARPGPGCNFRAVSPQ